MRSLPNADAGDGAAAPRELLRQLAVLGGIVSGTDDPIAAQGQDGRYIFVNDAYRREVSLLWGRDVQIGTSMAEMLAPWPDDAAKARAVWRRALDGEIFRATERFGGPAPERVYDMRFHPLHDASGACIGAAQISRNVTQMVATQDALLRSEATLRAVLDALPVGVVIADPNGRILVDNAMHRELWGPAPPTYRWQEYGKWEGYWPATGERLRAGDWAMARALLRGETVRDELVECVPFGAAQRRYFINNAAPVRNASGEIVAGVVVEVDVTERLAAERALRDADRRKDEFLATLAHELRNPLAPIKTGIEVMRLASRSGHATEQTLAMMDRQLTQMVRLIDDLLDLSRIGRGKIDLQRAAVRLSDVLRQAVEACLPLIQQARHTLTIDVSDEPILVFADSARLVQVFANLLTNAVKFTEPGGSIRLVATRDAAEAVVRIADSGVGMPPEAVDRVFERFAQLDQTLERSRGGLGIGLALVRELVAMHAGTVSAASGGVGHGSEFTVRLPVHDLGDPPAVAAHTRVASARRRVLVVDDNVDAATALAMMLRIAGHETRIAHDGVAALEAGAAFRPDVILLDIGLPCLNGYDAARRVRGEPWGAHVVLVAVTGWGAEEDRRRAREAGFDFHLVKPVETTALEDVLAAQPHR
jgi:signal transduction histidine kinase/CheY-like chemotaxis protein